MVFETGVKSIQAAAYNGARTLHILKILTIEILGKNDNRQTLPE